MEGFKNTHPLTKLTILFILGMLSLEGSSDLPLKTVKSRGLHNKALTFYIFQNSIVKHSLSFSVIILFYVYVHYVIMSVCQLNNSKLLIWSHMTRTKSRTRRWLPQTDCTSPDNRQLDPFSTLLLSSLNLTICNVGKSEIDESEKAQEMEEKHSAPGGTRSQHIFKVKNGREKLSRVQEEQVETGASRLQATSQTRRGKEQFYKVRTVAV